MQRYAPIGEATLHLPISAGSVPWQRQGPTPRAADRNVVSSDVPVAPAVWGARATSALAGWGHHRRRSRGGHSRHAACADGPRSPAYRCTDSPLAPMAVGTGRRGKGKVPNSRPTASQRLPPTLDWPATWAGDGYLQSIRAPPHAANPSDCAGTVPMVPYWLRGACMYPMYHRGLSCVRAVHCAYRMYPLPAPASQQALVTAIVRHRAHLSPHPEPLPYLSRPRRYVLAIPCFSSPLPVSPPPPNQPLPSPVVRHALTSLFHPRCRRLLAISPLLHSPRPHPVPSTPRLALS